MGEPWDDFSIYGLCGQVWRSCFFFFFCSWFDGALVDDGDDGTEGETGDEVSFGEVAMEKQSFGSGFVNI